MKLSIVFLVISALLAGICGELGYKFMCFSFWMLHCLSIMSVILCYLDGPTPNNNNRD